MKIIGRHFVREGRICEPGTADCAKSVSHFSASAMTLSYPPMISSSSSRSASNSSPLMTSVRRFTRRPIVGERVSAYKG